MRIHARLRRLIPLLGGLLLPGAGLAAIVDCQPAAGQQFTVFLSEPSGLPQGEAQREFLQRLQFRLDQSRDGRWVNQSPDRIDVSFVACFGRAPALDGQDLVVNARLIDGLYSRRVLMEVWGLLGQESAGVNAQMNYLLVPMQFAANRQERAPAALQRLRYPEQGATPTRDPVDLIARPLDLDAFVAAAYGFKLLREQQRELAHSNLCRAASLIGGMLEQRPLAGRSKADLTALRGFVIEAAAQAAREVQARPRVAAESRETAALRLQLPERPCAGKA